ncbi:hypothetical protein HHO41_21900 [Bacillus sp. DNRA2]|uniref:hypothetical protein n=1 Tax=Bacillus sp. DNRA2 TaxID=2723053 RepID=UPI00145D6032|nr:hypothetical protein [Bacillus sp. DNRA2]NMD72872.1 hypothetical protein [Bacillus sp. DNRA2]
MSVLRMNEVTRFLKVMGTRFDEESVQEWLNECNKAANDKYNSRGMTEDDLYDFNEWLRCKGTAYENGIDDKTKISRLLDEISNLKQEIETLISEKRILKEIIGIPPF